MAGSAVAHSTADLWAAAFRAVRPIPRAAFPAAVVRSVAAARQEDFSTYIKTKYVRTRFHYKSVMETGVVL